MARSSLKTTVLPGAKLEEDSVTTRELAPDACYTENYLNKSVITQAKLADGRLGLTS